MVKGSLSKNAFVVSLSSIVAQTTVSPKVKVMSVVVFVSVLEESSLSALGDSISTDVVLSDGSALGSVGAEQPESASRRIAVRRSERHHLPFCLRNKSTFSQPLGHTLTGSFPVVLCCFAGDSKAILHCAACNFFNGAFRTG